MYPAISTYYASGVLQCAGAMSVGYQLVIKGGNPQGLFHGAFMVRLLAAFFQT